MKHLALSFAALSALTVLTGCGGSDSGSDAATGPATSQAASPTAEDSPTEAAEADETRFQTAYADAGALFASINSGPQKDADPTSTEEANAAAGLDETTPLVFIDYTVLPDDPTTGSFCLQSNTTGTYIALTYSGNAGEADLGDGECSYDATEAEVVGNFDADEWSVGAELMGSITPTSIFE